jgi:hypothetical protein
MTSAFGYRRGRTFLTCDCLLVSTKVLPFSAINFYFMAVFCAIVPSMSLPFGAPSLVIFVLLSKKENEVGLGKCQSFRNVKDEKRKFT